MRRTRFRVDYEVACCLSGAASIGMADIALTTGLPDQKIRLALHKLQTLKMVSATFNGGRLYRAFFPPEYIEKLERYWDKTRKPETTVKWRNCLGLDCGKGFWSVHEGDRLCHDCRYQQARNPNTIKIGRISHEY